MSNNWPNFTPRAQKALALARSEAEGLGNNYISAEHLFLGMLAFAEGGAVNTLLKLGLDLTQVRAAVEEKCRPGRVPGSFQPFAYTPRVRMILKLAGEEAEATEPKRERPVGTEHILLGFLREADSLPARVLLASEIDADLVRQEIVRDPAE